jgi:hypothetical protein
VGQLTQRTRVTPPTLRHVFASECASRPATHALSPTWATQTSRRSVAARTSPRTNCATRLPRLRQARASRRRRNHRTPTGRAYCWDAAGRSPQNSTRKRGVKVSPVGLTPAMRSAR